MKRRSFIKKTSIAGLGLAITSLACTSKSDTEILILGGGLSGLYLAYLLEKSGKDYIVLEGSSRLGGRMYYRQDIGRDVGGRGIGDHYTTVMKVIRALNVKMIDVTDYNNEPTAIYTDGRLYTRWPDTKSNPRMLQYTALNSAPQLSDLDQWYKTPELDEPYDVLLRRLGLTEKELNLVNISANYNDIRKTSAINAYHSIAFRKYNGSKRILNFKGGTGAFTNAIANSLSRPVHKNKFIKTIHDNNTKVMVSCSDGSVYQAKKVVSTLPFTTLRKVKMNVSFNANQKKAIGRLAYTSVTQIHLQHTSPFWKEDETPLAMWTDTPLERVMNVSSHPDKKAIACWINGKGAAFFDAMSDAQIANYTLKKFKKIRPASEGKLEYLGTHSWGKYPYNKGAYVEFGVGQASWFSDMIRPAGNIHFAGEHTAHRARGIEGAAASAERVFNELSN